MYSMYSKNYPLYYNCLMKQKVLHKESNLKSLKKESKKITLSYTLLKNLDLTNTHNLEENKNTANFFNDDGNKCLDDGKSNYTTNSDSSRAATVNGHISPQKAKAMIKHQLKQSGYSTSLIAYELACHMQPWEANMLHRQRLRNLPE